MIDLKEYINKRKYHPLYKQSCDMAFDMLVHFDGIYPGALVEKRRPAESVTIKKYRKEIYVCPTQSACDKVMNSLMKIRKSQDWSIRYSKEAPAKVKKGESLYDYMEVDFPKWESFTNWYFGFGLRTYLTDANAVVLWMPLAMDEPMEDNQYIKPYPFIFKSDQVIDFVEEEWYLLKSKETVKYNNGNQTYDDGFIYYYVDNVSIFTIKQINRKGDYSIDQYDHNLTDVPVVPFGGIACDETSKMTLYKSRLSSMLPYFKEAVREYSDLQAEIVQHIHSTLWAYEGQECKKCHGTGSIPVKDAPAVECTQCYGRGFYPFNPYENIVQKRPGAGEAAISPPFAGFIEKQTAIAELQDKRIRQHKKDGLAALNMEFLIDPPQDNQSGRAKEVDRSELNNFVHSIAEDIVKFYDESYEIVCDYRYGALMDNTEERDKLLPHIAVPEKFDIVSETYLANELKQLQETKTNPSVINAVLIEYTNKKFSAEPDVSQFVINSVLLDPFSSEPEDSIMLRLQNNGISEQHYVIHCNIKSFLQRAVEENPDFFAMEFQEKLDVMVKYADEMIKNNSAKENVLLEAMKKAIPVK